MATSMRLGSSALALGALVAACAAPRHPGPPPGRIEPPAALTHVRCLVVAPLEDASDAAVADAVTEALTGAVDPARARVFPLPELRALFRGTPVDLPVGLSPAVAVETGELLGADAVLYGAVEGSGAGAPGGLLLTLRLAAAGERRLLFAGVAPVVAAPGEDPRAAARRTALELAGPVLAGLGDPGRKRCFEAERVRAVRELALAEGKQGAPSAAAPPDSPAPPAPPAAAPEAVPAATSPSPTATVTTPARLAPARPLRNARQAVWARTLAERGRVVLEGLTFEGRTALLQRDGALADLAVALAAFPDVRVRLDGFVDATSDPEADARLSLAMAVAAAQRLVQLGVDRDRIGWAGHGGEQPLLPNFTARGGAANRRVEVAGLP
jgi:outer membrane protein OmpA-like peptidoglycan-associated protein